MRSQTAPAKVVESIQTIPALLVRPFQLLGDFQKKDLRQDVLAGLTVAVVLLPQAIAFALIAELPPQMGLYSAIVAAIAGALWGSSNHTHTGPTNAISLLVLSVLLTVATPGTPEFVLAAGMLAVMAGLLQLILGLARLGVLVNFVSHSVIVGFASGAGVLIAINQLKHLVGIPLESHNVAETLQGLVTHPGEIHPATALLGVSTIAAIFAFRRWSPRVPGVLVTLAMAAGLVFGFSLDQSGVAVIGAIPRSLPPFVSLPLLDINFIRSLSSGALALAAIGLVETSAIARAIATQSGQNLDSNQEFVGQGLANLVAGFLSGYPGAGSFSRSALNFSAGAQSPAAAIFSSLFVLIGMFTLAPLAAFLPRSALAGVLIVTAYHMIDRKEIARIWKGTRGDAVIMVVTFLATLILHIEFAVLLGILLSFAIYIIRTSTPQVRSVLPDDNFTHLLYQPHKPLCPQLGILHIYGDLYFGAVHHIEKAIQEHLAEVPRQRILLLRLTNINQCDFSGIQMLESLVRDLRSHSGDVYLAQVQDSILKFMESTGFLNFLGHDHVLPVDSAITYLYHRVLDPAVCIYECEFRAFKECQNLPKQKVSFEIEELEEVQDGQVDMIPVEKLWDQLRSSTIPFIADVREPREFKRGHIPHAESLPLAQMINNPSHLPFNRRLVFVCQSGRRSWRAARYIIKQGYENVAVLEGGMLAWEAAGLLEAVEN